MFAAENKRTNYILQTPCYTPNYVYACYVYYSYVYA